LVGLDRQHRRDAGTGGTVAGSHAIARVDDVTVPNPTPACAPSRQGAKTSGSSDPRRAAALFGHHHSAVVAILRRLQLRPMRAEALACSTSTSIDFDRRLPAPIDYKGNGQKTKIARPEAVSRSGKKNSDAISFRSLF
jgi:hypothetical protein